MTFFEVRYAGRLVACFTSMRFAQLKKEELMKVGGCEENKTEIIMIYPSGKQEVVG